MRTDVLVMGSTNLDQMVFIDTFPKCGDNVVTKGSKFSLGGKGANQAVAVAKMKVSHAFLGAIGNDDQGAQILKLLEENGVDTCHMIRKNDAQTGGCVAIIDGRGENTCLGILGANMVITREEIAKAMEDIEAGVFLLQMETSRESVEEALKIAKSRGMYILLDPAPESLFFREALSYADLVTPNRMETKAITGIEPVTEEDALKAAKIIAEAGVKDVIIKMGAKGCLLYRSETGESRFIEATKVESVETIGAGDTFAGVLASLLAKKWDLARATEVASRAAALRVSRSGGVRAIPSAEELGIDV